MRRASSSPPRCRRRSAPPRPPRSAISKTSSFERERHQERAARVKAVLHAAGLPVMTSDTHIVPVFVGDPEKCKEATDLLLSEHGIYIQPINYPTVPKGTERLRITPVALPRGRADRRAGRGAGRRLGAARPAAEGPRAGGGIGSGVRQSFELSPAPARFQRFAAAAAFAPARRRAMRRATSGDREGDDQKPRQVMRADIDRIEMQRERQHHHRVLRARRKSDDHVGNP